ncbi:uncharacterized protein LOC130899386 [Diorhabda carinulata]|uniref:uncharacterized protein LOC130899386 n=1 Tax=Diorhabda carinulata TaxID=1163345 RepID=UPI0025A02F39|nr:uncharacterized protein LOC130899386 [Diorhabda carinulata]
MGSSQSKFKPDPNDVWYRVKVSSNQPKYLECVLQAIVNLKEPHGSSQGRIIDYIQGVINAKQIRPRPRNVAMQVKSALKYAVINGLVKQQGGKFIMALTEKEYAIFKGFRTENTIKENVSTSRSKSKSTRSRRRKRRSSIQNRHRSCSRLSDDDEYFDDIKPKKRKKYHEFESDLSSDYDFLSESSSNSSTQNLRKSDSYIKKKIQQINKNKVGLIQRRTNSEKNIVASTSTSRVPKPSASRESTSKTKQEEAGSSKGK